MVHPATGELLDLKQAPTDQLADWRLDLIELRHQLDALGSDLDAEMADRLDFEGTRSAEVGDFQLAVQAPTIQAYDEPRLSIALEALVHDGRISRGVAERVIRVKVERQVSIAQAEKLEHHVDPEVREAVARCRADVTRTRRRVTVERVR